MSFLGVVRLLNKFYREDINNVVSILENPEQLGEAIEKYFGSIPERTIDLVIEVLGINPDNDPCSRRY